MSFGKKYISEETNELGRGCRVDGKRYNNPYFDNKPKPDYRKRLKMWLVLAILCVILGIFLTAPFFAIKSVEIENEGRITNDKIADLIIGQKKKKYLNVLSQENIFLFKSVDLINKLSVNYNFKDVEFLKKFPNKLSVSVVQRIPAYIISENDAKYLIDEEGFVITKEVNQTDSGVYVEISRLSSSPSDISKFNQEDLHLSQISSLLGLMKSELSFIVNKALIGADPDTIELKIKDGPKVYFSAKRKLEPQIQKLAVIKDELKENLLKKEYIDLRIEENIYIK